jgi:hypothetical protein
MTYTQERQLNERSIYYDVTFRPALTSVCEVASQISLSLPSTHLGHDRVFNRQPLPPTLSL